MVLSNEMRGYSLGIQIIVQAMGFIGAMPFYELGKCVILEWVQPDKQMGCSLHEFGRDVTFC